MPKAKNPHVFLDISIDGGSSERITFELFANVVPKTAENFRALCTGERGLGASTLKPLYYKGTNIHRIVKGFVAQGGDFSRGDGRGGESIYGGKFQDENFRLMHDQPGVLSMANSGPDTNGSQFFITFKALPHLDGKHVVFGKVVSGVPLLKKLEAVGTEIGNPSCNVKIVDCGEVSDINSQDQLHGEKEKKLRKADGKSEGRVKPKKASSADKQRRKRKHYSSDSYSSDSSDSLSYSSDESESYSSSSMDTSSSSDHRRKRRKGSKKDKRKPAKRKSKHTKSKRKSRGSKRRSRRSYGSSSDDSISSKTDNSSSDSENAGHHTKHSLRKDKESTKMAKSEQGRTHEDVDKGKQMVTTDSQSHDAALSKDENGARDRSGNQNSEDRNAPGASSRITSTQIDVDLTKPGKADGNTGADASEAGVSRISTEGNPSSNEPVATNGKNLAVGSADNGQPQRIRKGRGFTQKYGYARRYRTPSPERPPVRPRYDGGRNDRWNSFNRYGRNGPYSGRSPVKRYHGSPRASSPSRYPRRDRSRSRSRSRSPVRRYDRGGYHRRSPRRSRSPAELPRRDGSNRPRPGRGGGSDYHRGSSPPANMGRSRSRSKSHDPSRSRSPEAAPAKRESSKYNRRRSSSSRSSSPDGNKGLVSY